MKKLFRFVINEFSFLSRLLTCAAPFTCIEIELIAAIEMKVMVKIAFQRVTALQYSLSEFLKIT